MKWTVAFSVAAVFGEARRFSLRQSMSKGLCGQGFDSLNPGTQDYFNTISETLWTHPANSDGFGVFQEEMKCWFSRMIDGNCGGLSPVEGRKKTLFAQCNDVKVDYLDIWKQFSEQEFAYFKGTFPSDKDSDYSQALTTMKELNMKEVLCTTLFVIDDGCVAFKYVKKA